MGEAFAIAGLSVVCIILMARLFSRHPLEDHFEREVGWHEAQWKKWQADCFEAQKKLAIAEKRVEYYEQKLESIRDDACNEKDWPWPDVALRD